MESREHVLPEFLGGKKILPDGAVCKECNNNLNAWLDQPLKIQFQSIIAYFDVRSSKRDSAASARVQVATSQGPIAATMLPGGQLTHPEHSRRALVREGDEVLEEWIVRADVVEDFIEERSRHMSLVDVTCVPLVLGAASGNLRGKAEILLRSTVRAGVNLVALKAAALLPLPEFQGARSYVLRSDCAVPKFLASVSALLLRGQFEIKDCRLEHAVLFSAKNRGSALFELRLFGDIFCRVQIADEWSGPSIDLKEQFLGGHQPP
ncbi:HNH endonuclease [Myxococcus sp. MxC21-1]|uniref:HNH endonuclease n=1 Tax=Myxococcus sp. MxC21-1 TaxID=3041439 RepID=UPI00292DD80E|nr:HNH endonuclease [Myxococcus sp. MxC21-1]WNZ60939.1 HNH endonuclease [Myxococcus sp. MxC21-1]